MRKEINETHRLLERWGSYCRQVGPQHLGYPTHATFATPTPSAACSSCSLSEFDEVQARRLDRILAILKQQDVTAYRAIEQLYLWRVSAVEAAARIGVSRRSFYTAKACGEAFVAGALSTPAKLAA